MTGFEFLYEPIPEPKPITSGIKGGSYTQEEYEQAMKELYPDTVGENSNEQQSN